MNRVKLFMENFLAYGLIGVLNKIVPFFMLPVITRLLPDTADFGRFDMYSLIVNFGASIAALGMYDAMFREFFEKDDPDYRRKVTSTACGIVGIAALAVMGVLLLFSAPLARILLGGEASFLVIAAAFGVWITANSSIISAPTRMKNERSVYIVSGLAQSVVYYGVAIGLIHFGVGYSALIYANLFALLGLLLFFLRRNRGYFLWREFDSSIAKELFKIGLPLFPVFLIYWLLSSVDKMMIANMCGMAEVGIYSIGLKLASVSQFLYMAFAGGWQYFAFSTMKDRDQVELTSKVFAYLGIASYLMLLAVLPFSGRLFALLFSGAYLAGNCVFPYLFLAPLLLMLFQTAANQFLVVKKTHYGGICLLIGLLVNVVLNAFWIERFGIKGAAAATLAGYAAILLAAAMVTVKLRLLWIEARFIIISAFIGGMMIALFFNDGQIVFWHLAAIGGMILYLYRGEAGVIYGLSKKLLYSRVGVGKK